MAIYMIESRKARRTKMDRRIVLNNLTKFIDYFETFLNLKITE